MFFPRYSCRVVRKSYEGNHLHISKTYQSALHITTVYKCLRECINNVIHASIIQFLKYRVRLKVTNSSQQCWREGLCRRFIWWGRPTNMEIESITCSELSSAKLDCGMCVGKWKGYKRGYDKVDQSQDIKISCIRIYSVGTSRLLKVYICLYIYIYTYMNIRGRIYEKFL